MMIKEKISGGSARLAQIMLLLFFIPFIFFLSYLILTKNFTLEGVVVLFVFIAVISLILRNVFSYADIYIFQDHLIVKKLFSTKNRSILEIKYIDKALFPFTFFLKFEDNSKVFFFSETSDLLKQLMSSDPDKGLKIIRDKLSKDDLT